MRGFRVHGDRGMPKGEGSTRSARMNRIVADVAQRRQILDGVLAPRDMALDMVKFEPVPRVARDTGLGGIPPALGTYETVAFQNGYPDRVGNISVVLECWSLVFENVVTDR